VEIGPFSVIGPDVQIGARSRIGSHVVIEGPTRIGTDNALHSFSSFGGPPQDKKFEGEVTELIIGDRNTIREFCTFNRGTRQGGGVTRIGNDNWIMAYVHIAHDCMVGRNVTMANGATLAGHVEVADFVTLGAFTVVHQFCSIGCHAFTAMGTVVFKDVPPYVTASGNSASPHGINTEGLRRHEFTPVAIRALRQAYKTVYRKGLTMEQAIEALGGLPDEEQVLTPLVSFLRRSSRGIIR